MTKANKIKSKRERFIRDELELVAHIVNQDHFLKKKVLDKIQMLQAMHKRPKKAY